VEVKVSGDYYIRKQRGGTYYNINNDEIIRPDRYFVSVEIINWLKDNIGPELYDWSAGATDKFVIVMFNNEEDATAFKLRWL